MIHTWYLSMKTSGLLLYCCSSSALRSPKVSSASPICWLLTALPLIATASIISVTQLDSACGQEEQSNWNIVSPFAGLVANHMSGYRIIPLM